MVDFEVCERSSVVEHRLHTAGVGGSKPSARTKKSMSDIGDNIAPHRGYLPSQSVDQVGQQTR